MTLTSANLNMLFAAASSWQCWHRSLHWILVIRVLFTLGCGLLASAAIAATSAATTDPLLFFGDRNLPPYEYIEHGQPMGANVDLVRAIGRVLGRPVELQLMDWGEAQSRLLAGEGHALTFLTRTDQRATQYDFSMPTLPSAFALFVRTDNEDDFNQKQLQGKRIGVTKGSFSQQFFTDTQPQMKLVVVDGAIDGTKRLLRGEIDALAANHWSGLYLLKELNISGIVALPPFSVRKGNIAVRKGDEVLRSDIDRALTELQASGEFDQIIDLWSSKKVYQFSEEVIKNSKLAAAVAVLAMVLLSVAVDLLYRKQKERDQLLAQMQRQKAFLEGVMTHAQACIAVIAGPELRYSFVNPAYQALVPHTPMPRQRFRDIFPDMARMGVEQQLLMVRQSGQPWRIEQFPAPIPGKPEALWEGQAVLLPTAEDEQSVLVMVWDITERAQAELARQASAATLQAVLNATQESVWLFSNDGTIVMGNQIAAARLGNGIAAEQMLGKSLHDYLAPELANTRLASMQTVVKSAQPLEFEDQQGCVLYRHSAYPVCAPDGQVAQVATFSRDITLERKASQALQAAIEEADRANNAKSRFLATVSHDLRQPLSALCLYLAVLKNRLGTQHAELTGSIKECLTSLSELLSDLLDLSKLQAQVVKPNIRDFEVADLLAKTCAVHMPKAQLKQLRLKCLTKDLIGRSDPVLYGRLLGNLVSNAVRYTERGGVLVGCRKQGGKTWIEVWDSGIGIPADKTREIFEEFRQLGDEARNRGSGLGLAIVAKTAELLGLQIRVRSRLGRGSLFAIELPLGSRAESLATTGAALPALPALRIAMVEDNPMMAEALRYALAQDGHVVICATSGAQLLQQLQHVPPDIVISDYRLADGETGFEVIRAARGAFDADLPALIITGDTDPNLIRSMASNGIRLLHKPLDLAELQQCMVEMFARTA